MSDIPWPSTKAAGDIVSASSDWNKVVDAVQFLATYRPQCKVYRATAQAIPDAFEDLVLWDAESWDNVGMHNTGVLTSRLNVLFPGRYRFTTSIRMDSADFKFYIQLRLNGNAVLDGLDTRTAGTALGVTDWGAQATVRYDCVPGDYWEVGFWHNRGSALNVRVNSWAELEWTGHNL